MMSWELDDEIEAVLKRIQRFDPVGVAARDLKECLLIQLSSTFPTNTPYLERETQLVGEALFSVIEVIRDFRQLMSHTKLRGRDIKSSD